MYKVRPVLVSCHFLYVTRLVAAILARVPLAESAIASPPKCACYLNLFTRDSSITTRVDGECDRCDLEIQF